MRRLKIIFKGCRKVIVCISANPAFKNINTWYISYFQQILKRI